MKGLRRIRTVFFGLAARKRGARNGTTNVARRLFFSFSFRFARRARASASPSAECVFFRRLRLLGMSHYRTSACATWGVQSQLQGSQLQRGNFPRPPRGQCEATTDLLSSLSTLQHHLHAVAIGGSVECSPPPSCCEYAPVVPSATM